MNDYFRNILLAFILMAIWGCCGQLDRIAYNVSSLYGHSCK